MTTHRPIVFGNWKMHGLRADGQALARAVAQRAPEGATLGVFPPFTLLAEIAAALKGTPVVVGAQDCHDQAKGAFTGSVSAAMVADSGATHVLLGHSERRHGLGETDSMVRAKAAAAVAAGLLPVVCIGETEAEYVAGSTLARLDTQIAGSLPDGIDAARLVIAYEPVWAIGTGRTPTLDEIAATHAHIRATLARSLQGGGSVPILYGGSVKGSNAAQILAVPDVGGALVGGASLNAEEFAAIAAAGR